MATNSLTVYDDEIQDTDGFNKWGEPLRAVAIRKGMPTDAKFFTRRNDSGNGTLFEWD